MATLIAVYNSEGLVGRCDAKCYKAASSKCECVCGGTNHGAGRQKATDNTREMAEWWIKEYSATHSLGNDVYWDIPAAQLTLPI